MHVRVGMECVYRAHACGRVRRIRLSCVSVCMYVCMCVMCLVHAFMHACPYVMYLMQASRYVCCRGYLDTRFYACTGVHACVHCPRAWMHVHVCMYARRARMRACRWAGFFCMVACLQVGAGVCQMFAYLQFVFVFNLVGYNIADEVKFTDARPLATPIVR